jgi:hypothetical protein
LNLLREKTLDYQTTHTMPNQEQMIALVPIEKIAEAISAFVNPGNAFFWVRFYKLCRIFKAREAVAFANEIVVFLQSLDEPIPTLPVTFESMHKDDRRARHEANLNRVACARPLSVKRPRMAQARASSVWMVASLDRKRLGQESSR